VTVRATAAAAESCTFIFTKDGNHGDEFSFPTEVPERYTWRSKVVVERAARAGVKMDEMMASYWPADTPRPKTRKERDSLRVRLGQRTRAQRAVEGGQC
jgi:hypothetical protein